MKKIEIKIPQKQNFFEILFDWRRNRPRIKFGTTIHFKGEGNKKREVESGDVLVGFHSTEKGDLIHGKAYVEKVHKQTAMVSITGTNYKK